MDAAQTEMATIKSESGKLATAALLEANPSLEEEQQQKSEARTLEEMERRYHSLIRGAVHGFCRTTANGMVVEANPAMLEMLGYESEKELIGVNLMAEIYTYPTDAASTFDRLKGEGGVSGAEAEW